MNSDDGFGSNCLIGPSDPLQGKKCFIDVLELDLYRNPIKFQYNVAPDMCQHLGITPSWHWNYSSGQGPSVVNIVTNTTTNGTAVTSCTATRGDGGPAESCLSLTGTHPEVDIDEFGSPTCIYNKTASGGPNCCFGEYVLNLTDNVNGSSSSVLDWGGDPEACIGGPIKTGTGEFAESGYPATSMLQVPADGSAGLNAEYEIAANIEGPKSRFSFPSNFYTTVGNPHSHTGFNSTRVSTMPYAFDPVDDLDGSSFGTFTLRTPRSDGYLFECFDEGFEVKYFFEVYVREWNTLSDFLLYGSSEGATYNPDVVGTEGVDCTGIGGECNDRYDFDDILSGNGGLYDTSGGVSAFDREGYFPAVDYQ